MQVSVGLGTNERDEEPNYSEEEPMSGMRIKRV
jgi:hypothetical protein